MKSNDQYKILIVDDNQMNLLVAAKTLENFGFQTATVESGKESFIFLETELPALILLDIMMPEMDGYEVCRLLKKSEKWKEIPVIFLTANTQTENIVEGFDAGGVDYLTKPFKPQELRVRVINHIELAESKKMIVEMNRSRDKLYSIIAHDIRSPLSGIQQTIDAIDQGFFDPASDDFKDIIHHLLQRTKETSTLLTSLLQWTRLQSDTIKLEFQLINLTPVLLSCVNLLNANAMDKSIKIDIDFEDEVWAWCDEVSVHTVFRNLISNAIKFTRNNGHIKISAFTQDSITEVRIEDNGVGMSQATVDKIFRDNTHHTTSGTANEQGSGLGLMLVKDFVSKNYGKIFVESTEGVGTVFNVKLLAIKVI